MNSAVWMVRTLSVRHWRQAPGQLGALVAMLSLGVGAFLAIRIANRAAVASFRDFADTLSGASDWIVEAPSGTLPQSVLPELRAALGTRPVAIVPVVETTALDADHASSSVLSDKTYTLLGLDLISVADVAEARGMGDSSGPTSQVGAVVPRGADPWSSSGGAPEVWVPRSLASRKILRLSVDDTVSTASVAGAIPVAAGAPEPPDTLLIMDLGQAQKLMGKVGRLDRIELVVASGPGFEARREEVGSVLANLGRAGNRWGVRSPGTRRATAETMTAAFRMNLTILSLIALLVGLYLILLALDGTVVRRRGEIAILRSLGFDESTVRRAWLGEAAVLGVAGGVVGIGLGWIGAQGAVRAVGQTVNTLYFATTVASASVQGSDVAWAVGIGLVASIAAGVWPAKEASQTPPAQILVRRGAPEPGAALWRTPWLGILLIVAGFGLARLGPIRMAGGVRLPLAGYGAALAWIVGGGMACGSGLPAAGRLVRMAVGSFAPSRVAAGHLLHPAGRHRTVVAAMVCATGMCAGMAVLVSSFEQTVTGWVSRSLQADLYLSAASLANTSSEGRIREETIRALAAHPGVADWDALSAFLVQIGDGAPAVINGADLARLHSRLVFSWVEAPDERLLRGADRIANRSADVGAYRDADPGLANGTQALVSESFAERFRVHRGDPLTVPTPAGAKALRVAGVFADYGNERGSILVDRAVLAGWMGDTSVTHVSLYASRGVSPGALREALVKEFPAIRVLENGTLRTEILRIFRQTFAITYSLEVIGVFVAVAGLALATASLLLDRREELTTLRALGFSRAEIATAASIEGVAVALWATAGGLLLSLGLGWLLIHVVNKQAFGWTLGFAIPWYQFAGLAGTVCISGWAACHAVGRWGSTLPADREE